MRLLLLLVLFSGNALAASRADVEWMWDGTDNLDFVITDMKSDDPRILNCGTSSKKKCYFEMTLGNPSPIAELIWKDTVGISGKQSIEDVTYQYVYIDRKIPKSGRITRYNGKDCITVYLRVENADATMFANSCSGSLTPPPPPPPPPVNCNILNNLIISHGEISAQELSGHQRSGEIRLQCSRDATVKLYARAYDGTNVIKLGNNSGITSQLSINGTNGAVGYKQKVAGGRTYTITVDSMLKGKSEAGNFSGSGVFVLDVI